MELILAKTISCDIRMNIKDIKLKNRRRVLVLDFRASESGSLSILQDLHSELWRIGDEIDWTFMIGTPYLEGKSNINVLRYPKLKKYFFLRLLFEKLLLKRKINALEPDLILNLQNNPIKIRGRKQIVYLHLPFILTDVRLTIWKDGLRLWAYQKILKKAILKNLTYASEVIVQTNWMKEALLRRRISKTIINIIYPKINKEDLSDMENCITEKEQTKITLLYPATGFAYKNHMVIIDALKLLKKESLDRLEIIFTLDGMENRYTKSLKKASVKYELPIKFIGKLDRKGVFQYLAKSTLIFPSYIESYGLPLLEAKQLKRNIIAADTPFAREILSDYSNLSLFIHHDHIKLSKLISKSINVSNKSQDSVLSSQVFEKQNPSLAHHVIKEVLR